MNPRLSSFVLVAAFAGCGDGSAPAVLVCRDFATRMESSGPGLSDGVLDGVTPVRVDCAFDAHHLEYACQAPFTGRDGVTTMELKAWRYASLRDFVEEGRTVGAVRAIGYTVQPSGNPVDAPMLLIPDRPIQGTNTFDVEGRLVRSVGSATVDFVAWDPAARPTRAAFTPICSTDEGTRYQYDDTTRRTTTSWQTITLTLIAIPLASRPCLQAQVVRTFDGSGNVTSATTPQGVPAYYSIKATERVCVSGSSDG